MRVIEIILGLFLIMVGVISLGLVAGLAWITVTDLIGLCLILSGILFTIPVVAWRNQLPLLTALLVPASLAFAAGVVLMYTGRAGPSQHISLWTLVIIAPGLALLAVYYSTFHFQVIRTVAFVVIGLGALYLALSLSLAESAGVARLAGALLLILVGFTLAFATLPFHRRNRPAVLQNQTHGSKIDNSAIH